MAHEKLLVMRHGEKAADPDDPDLTPAGRNRAEALPAYIEATFGRPDFIFAATVSRHSARPLETVQPLANKVGLRVNTDFADQDYGSLAKHLRKDSTYDGKLVVICWHHGNIPNLMNALAAPRGSYPDPWPRDVFNLILEAKFDAGGAAPTVQQITEPF
jgi:phosphohistidine phosphatase SixA